MKLYSLLLFLILFAVGCKKDDMTGAPTLAKLTIQDISIDEGDEEKPLFIDIRLSEPVGDSVFVFLQSRDGTAEAGKDYEAVNFEVLIFPPGDLVESYRLLIYGDLEYEDDEEFTLTIEEAVGAQIMVAEAKITLINDDLDTSLLIPDKGYSTPESYPGMQLVWRDEFETTILDEQFWKYEIGTGNNGWGNNELQFYKKENTSIREGHLVIEAREESFSGRNYTSSRLITANKFDFRYGRVDIRAVLPYGQGIWPALWMLGANIGQVGWPACGELDIMEMIGGGPGRDDTVHGTLHWSNGSGDHQYQGGHIKLIDGTFSDEFHVFSVVWSPEEIRWYMDDQHYYTKDITDPQFSEFRNDFFFIFNVAVGGNWPGPPNQLTHFPQRMIVDYIRVFQEE